MADTGQTAQLYKRAEDAFAKRNYDYARDLFKQILLVDPNNSEARKALRATIIKKFQEQGAPSRFFLMARSAAANTQIAMNKNKPEKLAEVCQNYLLDDPSHSKIRGVLAGALMDLDYVEGAAAEAEMSLDGDPHNIPAAKVLVECYQQLGKIKEAQEILEKVAKHAPEDRDLERLQRDLAAAATMEKGFEDTSEGGFRAALKDGKRAEELERGHHLIRSDSDIQGQIAQLEEEMNENPTDPKIPRKIGDLYFEAKKDFKAAREWYKRASQLAPQDSVLKDKMDDCGLRFHDLQIAQAGKTKDPRLSELRATRLKFAIQSFERRMQDRPTDMAIRFDLGKLYLQAGPTYLDKAIQQFQQAVKDPKRKVDSHIFLGQAFQRKKLYDMADGQYRKAEECGVVQQDRVLFIWYNRALCLAEAGQLQKAMELGKQIMEQDIGYKDISQRVEQWQGA